MKNKKIIGFLGTTQYVKKATNVVVSFGYYRVSIQDKVKEIAKYLMKLEKDEINEEIIKQIRNRGYLVNRLYWINLVLASVPNSKDMVVIDDLRIEDLIPKVIFPYYICSQEDSKNCPPDIEKIIIENQENINQVLEKTFKHEISSSKKN